MTVSGDAKRAARVVRRGGVLLYPTETVYGLGCDPCIEAAVERVRRLKRRDANKPMLALTDRWRRVEAWAEPGPVLSHWMKREEAAPVTLLLPATDKAPRGLLGPGRLIGIRNTADSFCRALVRAAGRAVLSTSANPAGEAPPSRAEDVDAHLRKGVDAVVEADAPLAGVPSTVVREEEGRLVIVRAGAVSADALRHRTGVEVTEEGA